MTLRSFWGVVWASPDLTRVDALRALLEPAMTSLESEDAQAQRELDSLAHDDDPEPGAFYGLTPPEPNSTHTAPDHG